MREKECMNIIIFLKYAGMGVRNTEYKVKNLVNHRWAFFSSVVKGWSNSKHYRGEGVPRLFVCWAVE